MPIPHTVRRILAAAAITALAATGLAVTPAAAATGCRSVSIPVSAGLAGRISVHGVLCTPDAPTGELQVLLHGATYNSHYWDGEGVPDFSYQVQATAAGMTTLALDSIATGQTTPIPLSPLVTAQVQANMYHQVAQAARSGAIDDTAYRQVFAVGHSIGSLTLAIEASQHPADWTGVVLTGYTHLVSATDVAAIMASSVRPADLIGFPALDPGYLTTTPGSRAADFDAPGTVDPAVVAGDEANRDVVSAAQLADGIPGGLLPTTSLAIHVPVLEVDGSLDEVFCGPLTTLGCADSADLYAHEHTVFGGPLATYVAPGDGHDVTLALDAHTTDAAINTWVASVAAGQVPVGPLS